MHQDVYFFYCLNIINEFIEGYYWICKFEVFGFKIRKKGEGNYNE